MGLDASRNAWWRDVLEHGRHSRYAGYFDIDWESARAQLGERLLLPILADQYGAVLERGELRLDFDAPWGALVRTGITCSRCRRSRLAWSQEAHDRLQKRAGPGQSEVVELAAIIEELTSGMEGTARRRSRSSANGPAARGRTSLASSASLELVATHVREALAFNGHPGNADEESFDRLHGLLEAQAYRLSYWRTAVDEINYRRFFDVKEAPAACGWRIRWCLRRPINYYSNWSRKAW